MRRGYADLCKGDTMLPSRRAVDYTRRRHWIERALIRVSGDGWMANLAERAGRHTPLSIIHAQATIPLSHPHPPPLRAVFASDFHAGPITHPRLIDEACRQIAILTPDLLLLGGDFVSLDARYAAPLADALGRIPAPLGRYAVLGNHDLWADDVPTCATLERAQIRVLVNQSAHLPAPYEQITICGLDDPTSGRPDASALGMAAPGVRILLMHSPEGVAHIAGAPFDLALCGHTHGGQICLPSGRPLWLPAGRLNRRYPAGRYHLGPRPHQDLLVSRGVGYGGLPIRLFAPPDIICAQISWADPSAP